MDIDVSACRERRQVPVIRIRELVQGDPIGHDPLRYDHGGYVVL
jgi:hypothetical protein